MHKKIKFISNRIWLNKEDVYKPNSAIKIIPDWYRKADRFFKIPETNDYYIGSDGGKAPNWKACPALFDIISTGYVYVTPCDIEFYENSYGKISSRIENKYYNDFCSDRPEMAQFIVPHGYHSEHFAWYPPWAVSVPEGYSVLYSQPFNRFDLPFITVSGIIDNDKINLPGTMPFFLKKGFTGLIPAGTPFLQMLPFKREDWQSEMEFPNIEKMTNNNIENLKKYRVPNGGVYKNKIWSKRKYN